MKFLINLNRVIFDINGEYRQSVEKPIFLGLADVDTEEDANIIAERLAQDFYSTHYNESRVGFPYISVENIDNINCIVKKTFNFTYKRFCGREMSGSFDIFDTNNLDLDDIKCVIINSFDDDIMEIVSIEEK